MVCSFRILLLSGDTEMLYLLLIFAVLGASEGEVLSEPPALSAPSALSEPVAEPTAYGLPSGETVVAPEGMLDALKALGTAPLPEEQPWLCAYVEKEPLDLAARLFGISQYYETNAFTAQHSTNLHAHIKFGSADAEKMARFAGSFAAEGIRRYWTQSLAGTALSPSLILPFMESLYNDTPEMIRKAFASGIEDVFASGPLPLTEVLHPGSLYGEGLLLDAWQHCVTLSAFSKGFDIFRWIDMPRIQALFFKSTGVWLFGGEALNPEQLAILESVFTSIPFSLHGIAAAFVQEGIPAVNPENALRIPGYTLRVPVLDLSLMRDATLLPPLLSLPPLPEYTALLLEQVAQAVTSFQLIKRPELMQRCFHVLDWVRKRPEAGLEQIVPGVLMPASPDRLVTHLVYLWLINSDMWLDGALALYVQHLAAPFLSLLLAADVFSEGSDVTRLLHTTSAGKVYSEQTAVRRTEWAGVGNVVTAVALRGQLWHYEGDTPPVPWSF